jgi:hypothetical protein
MFWRLKSKVILLIILETIDFIVKSIFIVGVCKIGGVCIELFVFYFDIYVFFWGGVCGKIIQILFDYCSKYIFLSWF